MASRSRARLVRGAFLALLSTVFPLASALAGTPTRFAELRQAEPGIDPMVAALPSSDLTATFNHLSVLWNRKEIVSLPPGAGSVGAVPQVLVDQIAATLAELRIEVEQGLPYLATEDRWVLLQLASLYGYERTLELFHGPVAEPCASPSAATPCFALPLWAELDRLADVLAPVVDEVADWYDAHRGAAPAYAGAGGTGLSPWDVPPAVDDLGLLLSGTGIESIDG